MAKKLGVIFVYLGVIVCTRALLMGYGGLDTRVLVCVMGITLICGGIVAIRKREKDIGMKSFWLIFGVMTIFLIYVLSEFYFTMGEYRAVIYYEEKSGVYVLKGVWVYAKPERAFGKYRLVIRTHAFDTLEDLGIISYNPSLVKFKDVIGYHEIRHVLEIYCNTVTLERDKAFDRYINLNYRIVVEEPLDLVIKFEPLNGTWTLYVTETKVKVV